MYKKKYKSKQIEKRVLNVVNYVLDNKATIREAARFFGVSKSTVHKDITERIFELNPQKAIEVEKVLLFNKSERHLRGARATKLKFLMLREMNSKVIQGGV
ncbi:sporulation transcriptional regulator SpoIIID [Clostridium perfringens]|uniref:sporulation transcriptional regulator SpoIIID n=1 Tax=Clostridium perfringens TaxID=1502 RepID=UPI0007764BFE|nr:sporulation transcriptional regulator SpoIIID [Clostridium perfringens]AMN31744.1 stage III sporulation protein D [Clostridium perfringens]